MSIETIADIEKLRKKTSIILSQGMLVGQGDVSQKQLNSSGNENSFKSRRPFDFLNKTSP